MAPSLSKIAPKVRLGLQSPVSECRILDTATGSVAQGRISELTDLEFKLSANRRFKRGARVRITLFDNVAYEAVSIYAQVDGGSWASAVLGDFLRRRLVRQIRVPGTSAYEYRCRVSSWTRVPASFTKFYDRILSDSYVEDLSERRGPGLAFFSVFGPKIRFKIASGAVEKADAWKLVYQEYLRKGFIGPNPYGLHTSVYQLLPATATYVGICKNDTVLTLTAVCDSDLKLPSDRLFGPELDALRRPGRRLVEFTLLAARRGFFGKGAYSLKSYRKMAALFSLFRLATQHAMHVLKATDVVISVNPSYEKLYGYLQFNRVGPLRHYGEFNNHPALAFHLDLTRVTDPEHVKSISRLCLMRFFFNKRLDPDILEAPWGLSPSDRDELFIRRSDLARRLTPQEKEILAGSSPDLAVWLQKPLQQGQDI